MIKPINEKHSDIYFLFPNQWYRPGLTVLQNETQTNWKGANLQKYILKKIKGYSNHNVFYNELHWIKYSSKIKRPGSIFEGRINEKDC